MARQARLDAPEVLQHVMARGIERRKIFFDDEDYQFFKERLGKLVLDAKMDCLAWAFLPNHFHLLLRTHQIPLSLFMRRLMTAYAGYFNRRHHRSGHLFQNRYKSVVCEEEPYLLDLVRYIHLNPLRSGSVRKFGELERYRWCGHGVMMGRDRACWQRSGEVLGYFGKGLRKSRVSYGRYMAEGAGQGRRPELSGGGILRRRKAGESLGSLKEELSDRRVLGDGDFVERVLKMGGGERRAPRLSGEEILSRVAKWTGIPPVELGSGSKRPSVVVARSIFSYLAVRWMGMTTVEAGRWIKVTQSAVSKLVGKGERIVLENKKMMEEIVRNS
jgi:putative transposase